MINPQHLTAALVDLPEPARSVYLLSARDGLPHGTIAEQLGISVAEVEQALAEALVELGHRISAMSAPDAVAPDHTSG